MKLESAQIEMLSVLLGRVFSQGLISEVTYKSAQNSLATSIDFPNLMGYPVCLTKEATGYGNP